MFSKCYFRSIELTPAGISCALTLETPNNTVANTKNTK